MNSNNHPKMKPISLEEIRRNRKPIRDINQEHQKKLTPLVRMSIFISDYVGSPGFFLIIILWTVFWLLWNFFAPKSLQFDPPTSFVFWLFISNLIQIFLMPLIMVAQNIQSEHAEMRADNDFEINVKAEKEIEIILHHLEYQNAMLNVIMEKMGLTQEDLLKSIPKNPSLEQK